MHYLHVNIGYYLANLFRLSLCGPQLITMHYSIIYSERWFPLGFPGSVHSSKSLHRFWLRLVRQSTTVQRGYQQDLCVLTFLTISVTTTFLLYSLLGGLITRLNRKSVLLQKTADWLSPLTGHDLAILHKILHLWANYHLKSSLQSFKT